MTKILIAVWTSVFVFGINLSYGQEKEQQINWISWEEAAEQMEVTPKKIILDVYTSWCVWCKRMDESTFQNEQIAAYINEHFYPVRLDAEYREDIKFKGKNYKFIRSGRSGYHELAAELLNGRLSFPTIVFMDDQLNVIQSIAGYKTSAQFQRIITYFGSNGHTNTPWSTYQKSFAPKMMLIKNDKP